MAIVLPAASLAAYVIARYIFKGRELVYGLFTLGLLFPVAVAITPLFIVLRQVGLLSNPLGVALPQAAFGLPIAIIVMRPFFRAIPNELQDAAAIDGCGPFRFYWSVMLPLSRPVLSTIAVITVVGSWNAFFLPLLVLIDPSQHTLPIGVNNISAQYTTDYARVLAYTSLAMVPALLFYAVAERQVIGGLTAGAVRVRQGLAAGIRVFAAELSRRKHSHTGRGTQVWSAAVRPGTDDGRQQLHGARVYDLAGGAVPLGCRRRPRQP